jgi:2-polyprenyl-6-methoxyphenol hydroxylase-like FAD-dependent oxidoreductase
MYDVIVVGARVAGAPTAMLLARRGYQVLLVDRDAFPSDTMSTHYIHFPGIARLRKWGLLDRLWDAGTPKIEKVTVYLGDQAFSPPALSPDPTAAPRRFVLDKLLVDAAVESGVELRQNFSVRELVFDGDTVAGLRGKAKDAADLVEERARLVVGADGLHSLVARAVKPPEYDTVPSLTFAYYSYFSGVEAEGAELHPLDDGGILLFPTNGGMVCVAAGGPIEGFHAFREDIEGNFYNLVDRAGELGARVRAGKREERFVGTNDQPNYFRRPYGPGWALVGDAGYHRDFITGFGINDAFRDAELLADATDAWLAGRQPFDDAMAAYEATRNRLAKPLYDVTVAMASGGADPTQFLQIGPGLLAQMPEPVA